jgi:ATP-binding cassette subfamily B protein
LPEDRTTPRLRDALHVADAARLVWRAAPGWTALNLGVAAVQGLLPLLSLYLIKLIVDTVAAGVTATDHVAAFRTAALYVALAALVGLSTALLRSLGTLAAEAMGQVVTDHVSDLIHAKSVDVDLAYYENSAYYDVLHRAQAEAPYRPMRIVTDLLSTLQGLVSVLAVAGLLLSLHWAVGVVVIAAALPGALLRARHSGRLYRWERDRSSTERRAWYLHWLLTDGANAADVRLLGLGPLLRELFRDLRDTLRAERLTLAKRRAGADLVGSATAVLAVFATFALLAWRTIAGAITLGSMVMYYQAFQTGLAAIQQVLSGLAGLYEDNLFLTSFHEFMSVEPRVAPAADPVPVPRPMADGVRFDSVSFAYPDTERTALEDISIAVRPGEVTALVGPNGSGKTTLVKLLCRLYDPTSGAITLDGIDLRAFDVGELRRHTSVILQDFAKYQFTARENIRVGNVSLSATDPAIEAAAREAGIHETLAALRNGYDTELGKWFEDGEQLSVGEWQKVALARAFVREAQILVFDEPTSALDPEAEARVFDHIRTLASGRAVVLISHRFSTVSGADRIHILDGGRIVESGSHEELMALRGRYAGMYAVQARAYRS